MAFLSFCAVSFFLFSLGPGIFVGVVFGDGDVRCEM